MTHSSRTSARIHHAALATILAATVAGVACAPQGSQPSPELAEASDRWSEALNAGDIDAIVALYAADCKIMPPNAPTATGHDAVREIFGGMVAAGLKGELETLEATVSGDIGHKIGRYTLMAPDGTVIDRGKFMETWKKSPAGWLVDSDMYSSDLPVPSPGPMVVATHKVKDAATWLAAWSGEDSRHAMFAANGVASSRTMQNPEDPNDVAVIFEVSDMDTFMTHINSPETQAAKAEDGVIDKGLRFYAEAK